MRGEVACLGLVVAVCGSLLAGCTSGGGDSSGDDAAAGGRVTVTADPSPRTSAGLDPAGLPTTATRAAALVREVVAQPAAFGPDTVRSSPYESDPRRWAVLGEDCVWEQRARPRSILATLTRHYEVPAGGGRGPLRLTAVVTVHRTAERADWENAEVLEEMMRCPSQLLRDGEVLGELTDVPAYFGEALSGYADDILTETGSYASDELGGPHAYVWSQTRIGQFTLAVSAKGSEGWAESDLFDRLRDPHSGMRAALRAEVGRDAPDGGDPPSARPGGTGDDRR
ncbi:hypothetical protein [Streptomyces cadmiisoli]|uniref:hypothetical protein n=1 Tax=Streptomyces cadmiisoli TaxID=2184053 RepID=UPI003D708C9F